MSYRSTFRFQDLPPVDAEVYGNIKIARLSGREGESKCYVKAWAGKQSKPFAYYSFKDAESREAWINKAKADEDSRVKYRQEREAEQARKTAEMEQQIQVGTILHGSWGYDQTNCEYYQVVERKGRYAWVREIGHKTVEGSQGFDCCHVKPDRDNFIGPAIRKLIGPYGLSFDCFTLSPCDETADHYSSWYA